MKLAEGPRRTLLEDGTETRSPRGDRVIGSESGGRIGRWAARVGMGFLILLTATLLVISIGPLFLPYRTYAVLGGSMEPTIPTRSLLVLRPVDAGEVRRGDVITFHPPGQADRLVTHRVARIVEGPLGPELVTKGDANDAPDPWRIPVEGTGWRYVLHVPYLGYLQMVVVTPVGRSLLLAGAAIALGGWALVRIWRPQPSLERP